MNVEPLTDAAIVGAGAVFTSSMIVRKDALEPVIRRSKKSGKTVVAGGPYPTSSRESASSGSTTSS